MGIGTVALGRYELLEKVSQGGMAEVFQAKLTGSEGFEKIVALKVLLPHFSNNKTFINMLVDEAKIAEKLSHANIAKVFDLEKDKDRYYIVQEFINGLNLRMILRIMANQSLRIPPAYACHLIGKLCDGLDYAHNKTDRHGRPTPVIHRDVSPHNVLVSYDGDVKIIDFGVAKAEGRTTKTVAGILKGKLAYMSPEQVRGLPVDCRSDIFASGVLLHELLTGKPLFLRKTELETLEAARKMVIVPPSSLQNDIPKELDTIVMKALSRHASDRYKSAAHMKRELTHFLRTNELQIDKAELATWIQFVASHETNSTSMGHPSIDATHPPTNKSAWSAVFGGENNETNGDSFRRSAYDFEMLDPSNQKPSFKNVLTPALFNAPSNIQSNWPLTETDYQESIRWGLVTFFIFVFLMCLGAFVGKTIANHPLI